MPDPKDFLVEAWQGARPKVLAIAIDLGDYLSIWAAVTAAHLVRWVMTYIGIDPMLIRIVAFLEKWVFVASFASYFGRVIVRLWAETKKPL